MKTILPDTSALVDFLHGDRALSDVIETADRVLITPIVLGEFFAGLKRDARSRTQNNILSNLMEDSAVEYAGFTENTPLFYAKVFQYLKQIGKPIPTNDMWIAAFALETGSEILTRDLHFSRIPMLLIAQI